MGLRFRRSFKILPGVKLNIGKKGASVSTGTRGFHYTVGSSGRRTRSVGIPGTGLSYVSTSSGKSKKSNVGKKNDVERSGFSVKKFLVFGFIILVFISILGNACSGDDEETTTAFLETTTEETTTEETTTKETTTEETTTEETTTEETTTEETTTKETTTKETTTEKTTAEKTTVKETGRIVYVTPNGKRYHFSQACAGDNAIEKDINDVGGRTPCKKCAQ